MTEWHGSLLEMLSHLKTLLILVAVQHSLEPEYILLMKQREHRIILLSEIWCWAAVVNLFQYKKKLLTINYEKTTIRVKYGDLLLLHLFYTFYLIQYWIAWKWIYCWRINGREECQITIMNIFSWVNSDPFNVALVVFGTFFSTPSQNF